MSVQKIKWVILIYILACFMPEMCHAMRSRTKEIHAPVDYNGTQLDCRTTNQLNAFISMLFTTVGDLAEDISNITPDKKAFIRLLQQLSHNTTAIRKHSGPGFVPHPLLSDIFKQRVYYVYTLEKIVI